MSPAGRRRQCSHHLLAESQSQRHRKRSRRRRLICRLVGLSMLSMLSIRRRRARFADRWNSGWTCWADTAASTVRLINFGARCDGQFERHNCGR